MDGKLRRRHLPHWDIEGAPYFVTTCLAGSIPAAGLKELNQYRQELQSHKRPESVSAFEWQLRNHKLLFAKLDQLLDDQPAVRHFERRDLSTAIQNAIEFFDGQRYVSLAWVVMPSHLHWVFQPLPSWAATLPQGRSPREVIMHSLKSFTANQCNRLLGKTGVFWQDESYDHWVRDDGELERVVQYVLLNPVKARICLTAEQYEFSSAYSS